MVKNNILLTSRRGVDIIVGNVGVTFPQNLRALKKGGRLLTVGNTIAPKFEIDNRNLFGKHISIVGSTMGTRSDLSEIMKLLTTNKLKPAISKVFPLSDVCHAQDHLETGQNLGKVVFPLQINNR